jgi:hypothetical protein
MRRQWLRCLAGLFTLPAFAGQVVIVDGPAAGTYVDIASAVAAAQEGDVLLVGPGSYGAFTIDGKSLSVFAQDPTRSFVAQPIVVRNIPAGASVVLHGLQSTGSGTVGADALAIENVQGDVRVQACRLTGRRGFFASGSTPTGGDGAYVVGSPRVVFVDCVLTGGKGADGSTWNLGGTGGNGLQASQSSVAVVATRCVGGSGGAGGTCGLGGDGARLFGVQASFVAASIEGGSGGAAPFQAWCSGDGGDGLEAWQSTVRRLDTEVARGALGSGGDWTCAGSNGDTLVGDASHVFESGVRRPLELSPFGFASQPVPATVTAFAQDSLSLRASRRGVFNLDPVPAGPLLVAAPPGSHVTFLGVVPFNGTFLASFTPRPLAGARLVRVDRLQLVVDSAAGRLLGEPAVLAVFSPALGPDCNSNGLPDTFDIATGGSLDVDLDGIPDECP